MNAPVLDRSNSFLHGIVARLNNSKETIFSGLMLSVILAAGIAGWILRDQLPPSDRGLGYTLGIAGSGMMLLLLVYPLRKRLSWARWLGSVGFWFRFHMLLGLLGPLAILYHARFSYSATNSGVALIAMLVVVSSGLVGRFLYAHIHKGFSQRKLVARELLEEVSASRLLLDADGDAGRNIVHRLERLEQRATARRRHLGEDAAAVIYFGFRTRFINWKMTRSVRIALAEEAAANRWHPVELAHTSHELAYHLGRYLRAIRHTGGFAFYDRLFRAWHFLHQPLFLFLLVTAIIHVIAVHMY